MRPHRATDGEIENKETAIAAIGKEIDQNIMFFPQ
jgi:hypothetical protein